MTKKLLRTTIAFIIIIASIFPCDYVQAATGKFASNDTVIWSENDYCYAYHFGYSATSDAVFGINYEGVYGLKVYCDGSKVTYTLYNHTPNYTPSGHVTITPYAETKNIIDLGQINVGNTASFDMKNIMPKLNINIKYPNKIYELTFTYKRNNKESCSKIYLYYDGQDVYTCWITTDYYISNTIQTWNNLVGNIDPNKCLNMYVGNKKYPITYPTSGTNGDCNHVKLWREKSNEILDNILIKQDDYSDEFKVFMLVRNLATNYAYDQWRVQANHNQSRAMKYGKWKDDNLWMYYNGVGQCWDFANVLTIMCREQKIPCTTIENNGHGANIVWLNNEWVGIDVSDIVYHECWEENPSNDKWQKRPSLWKENYGVYTTYMKTHNQTLATPATTLKGGKGNPE